jgi:hypothetical protein
LSRGRAEDCPHHPCNYKHGLLRVAVYATSSKLFIELFTGALYFELLSFVAASRIPTMTVSKTCLSVGKAYRAISIKNLRHNASRSLKLDREKFAVIVRSDIFPYYYTECLHLAHVFTATVYFNGECYVNVRFSEYHLDRYCLSSLGGYARLDCGLLE